MEETLVKMVLDAWYATIKRADVLLEKLSDDDLLRPVAPGRNRGTYLLGHLTAVHDAMLPLLNLGEAQHPQLVDSYIRTADGPAADAMSPSELRAVWHQVNAALASGFSTIKPEEWFLKHNSVSAEDFAKEPHRNRLNVLNSRTNHLSYHMGQIAFLKG